MKRAVLPLLAAVFFFLALRGTAAGIDYSTRYGFSTGIRIDSLDWNIAGNMSGANPNILSELTWNGLKSYIVGLNGRLIMNGRFYFKGNLGFGWIYEGRNRDSDYNGDNRTLEFSRSDNNTDDDYVLDGSIGAGYMFRFVWEYAIISVIPLAGYSYSEQNLVITDGYQTVPPTGPFAGLDSNFNTQWQGPWIGVETVFELEDTYFTALFEYHWTDYYAVADWNLRTDLEHPRSFEQDAYGRGVQITLGWNYSLTRVLSVNARFHYRRWAAEAGVHRFFKSGGAIIETRLNEVNWTSAEMTVGLKTSF